MTTGQTTPTLNGATLQQERDKIDKMFFDYLENRRRQLLGELRDIETHLVSAGRIKRPSLRPTRQR